MEKNIEQMRQSVMAYCETVCPQTRDKYPHGVDVPSCVQNGVDISCSTWNRGKPSWWVHDLLVYEYQDDRIINLAYRLLGLSERDAVAAERAEMMKTVDALSAMVTVDPVAFAQLEAKNAALVAALEKIYAADNDPAIELIAKNALAANEKGGKGE